MNEITPEIKQAIANGDFDGRFFVLYRISNQKDFDLFTVVKIQFEGVLYRVNLSGADRHETNYVEFISDYAYICEIKPPFLIN